MDNFKKIIVLYTILMGIYQVADYFYGISYMVILNSSITVKSISIIIGIKEACNFLFDFPSGVISDYIGRKKTAAFSLILYGFGLILLTRSNTFLAILLVFVLISFANSMFSGSPQAWFYDIMVKKNKLSEREKILPRMSGVVKIISMSANFIAVILISINVHLPLFVGGILVIIIGLIFLFAFEDNKGKQMGDSFVSTLKKFSVAFFSDKRMRGMLCFEIFDYAAFSIFIFSWQLCVLNDYSLTERGISILFVCFTLVMAMGNFATSFLHKYLSGFSVSMIGRIGMIMSFIVLFISNLLWIAVCGFVLFEFFFTIAASSISVWRNDYISSNNRASFYSGISSVKTLLAILVTIFIGSFIEMIGYKYVWLVAVLFEALSLLFTLRFIRKYKDCKEIQNE